jgi:hypothetical protein
MRSGPGERGGATVEHAGLSLLIALLVISGIAALASGPTEAGRDVGFALARKLRCAAQGPRPCWRDPLTEAYGRALAGAVRASAPEPGELAGLLPVDFRRCRQAGCARPGPRHGLTASNRRVTLFVQVRGSTITYWEYRPGLGWASSEVAVGPAELSAMARTPLLEGQVPVLVPLETLAGANHVEFAAREEPPWRWRIARR